MADPVRSRQTLMRGVGTFGLALSFWCTWRAAPTLLGLDAAIPSLDRTSTLILTGIGLLAASIMSLLAVGIDRTVGPDSTVVRTSMGAWTLLGATFGLLLAVLGLVLGPLEAGLLLVQLIASTMVIAPLLFGVSALWRSRGAHLVIAILFSFVQAAGARDGLGSLPFIIGYAAGLLIFIESGESLLRLEALLEDDRIPATLRTEILGHYLRNLPVVCLGATAIGAGMMIGRLALDRILPPALGESLEAHSAAGFAVPAVLLIGAAVWLPRVVAVRNLSLVLHERIAHRRPTTSPAVPPHRRRPPSRRVAPATIASGSVARGSAPSETTHDSPRARAED